MYTNLMKNSSRLGITNLKISKISSGLDIEEQKPFLLLTPEDDESTYLGFVHKNFIYMTPFKSVNSAIIARLKTVLTRLDQTVMEIDTPLFLVRNGIPLKKVSFQEKKAVFSDMDMWKALTYQRLPHVKTTELLRDLRDLLYV